MTTTNHTPLPWTRAILKNDKGQDVYVIVHKGEVVAECGKEDGVFIVKAANNFELLVTALSAIKASLSIEEAKVHAEEALRNVQTGKTD